MYFLDMKCVIVKLYNVWNFNCASRINVWALCYFVIIKLLWNWGNYEWAKNKWPSHWGILSYSKWISPLDLSILVEISKFSHFPQSSKSLKLSQGTQHVNPKIMAWITKNNSMRTENTNNWELWEIQYGGFSKMAAKLGKNLWFSIWCTINLSLSPLTANLSFVLKKIQYGGIQNGGQNK